MKRILPVVFLTSMAALAFQVLLIRIFSISLWYHFAFMIISIAMLGLAAGGTALSLYPRLQELNRIGSYTLCLGIAIPVAFLAANLIPFDPVRLSWEKSEILYLGLYYLVLAMPFFFTGLIIATAFTAGSERSGQLYGADLLGAGIGSLGILLITGIMAPERVVFVLSTIVLCASFLVEKKGVRSASLFLLIVNLTLFVLQPGFARLKISPYKELSAALRYPGAEPLRTYHTPFARIDTFRSPAVRFAPGLSLAWLEPLPEQVGFAVDGGTISAITDASDQKSLEFLTRLPAALPYETGSRNRILVLDPSGGLQILLARRYGAGDIVGIETNPWLTEIIRNDFGDFSGNIYEKKTWNGLGRSWLAGRSEKFDLIDISPGGAAPGGSFGIAEDYRFTVEAFGEYLEHLSDDGVICVNLFMIPPPRIELRIVSTVTAAMESMGIRRPDLHIAAIRSWGTVSILVGKAPLTTAEIAAARNFAERHRFDTVYLPDIRPQETNRFIKMPTNEYAEAFAALISPEGRREFLDKYIFDVGPVYDDAPFFHYFLKTGKIGEVYRVMGGKWQFFLEEGYIVPALMIQAAALSALLMLLPALAGRREKGKPAAKQQATPSVCFETSRMPPIPAASRGNTGFGLLPYFAFLGFAFMFVEITLIQKLILPLVNPSYAVAAVLASLLFASGAGSLVSSRAPLLRKPVMVAGTAIIIILYSLLLPGMSSMIANYQPPVSFLLVLVALFPAGFLMGIPFPTGLKLLGERNTRLIPWAWAINGCCSVLGPLGAILLAMAFGFRNVLLLGALCYFLAFLNIHFYRNQI